MLSHLLRSTSPKLSLPFFQSFNQIRTEFLSELLNIDSKFLCEHLFCSPDLGDVVFTKSRILTKSAFIGAGKNFVFEFHQRFSTELTLPGSNCSPYLSALERELDALPLENWLKCFLTDV
ncbi:hypothetical protein RCL1_001443 [Eukaryota sp. TZLM3-RCL]